MNNSIDVRHHMQLISISIICRAYRESVQINLLSDEGTIFSGPIYSARPLGDGYFLYLMKLDIKNLGLRPNEFIQVIAEFIDESTMEHRILHKDALISPDLAMLHTDYPFLSNWATSSEISSVQSSLTRAIESGYLGNKKIEMFYCEEVPNPNPRKLFIGCEDYMVEKTKRSYEPDWSMPSTVMTTYYWYDDEGRKIISGEEE